MDFTFSDDQIAFRDAVRDLLADRCTPADLRAAWEADSPWSEARWSALAEMGVIGATVPEADGGLGFGLTDVILLAEEAGRVALPEPMTAALAVVPGLLTAAGENGTKWLARLATGESVVVASLDGGPWVVGAAEADLVLVRDGEDLLGYADGGWSAETSVDRSRRPARRTDGDPEFRVADIGDAMDAAFDRGVTAVAAELVGSARHLIEVTVAYAQERHQFGQPIGGFQAVKHHLADALLAVEFAAPTVYRAALSLDQGTGTGTRDASMAKAMAGDAAELAARVALQVHGAIGYTFEFDLHLWMKRVWAQAASWGDADWHRARVSAAVLDVGSVAAD